MHNYSSELIYNHAILWQSEVHISMYSHIFLAIMTNATAIPTVLSTNASEACENVSKEHIISTMCVNVGIRVKVKKEGDDHEQGYSLIPSFAGTGGHAK